MRTDEWTPLEEMFALGNAGSVEEFHRRLVLFPSADRNRSDAFEPVCWFRHYHETKGHGAATTALLLVTDRRWRNATGRIMEGISNSGLIGDDDLDLLAQAFLAAGPYLYWKAPEDWFDDGIEIVLEHETNSRSVPADPAPATSDGGPTVVRRELRPPLRRWAAARLVRRDPTTWGSVLQRAGELEARNGAAVLRGLLDAVDSLPERAQSVLVRRAAVWPQRDVRAAAEALTARARRPRSTPRGAPNTPGDLGPVPPAAPHQMHLF